MKKEILTPRMPYAVGLLKKALVIVLGLVFGKAGGQFFHGYETDNFSGIHGVIFNPANSADSRVKLDINLLSFSSILANDYIGLSLGDLNQILSETNFDDLPTRPSNSNNLALNLSVLGPSFMFSLNEKHSVGLFTRARVFNTVRNVNGLLLESLLDEFGTEDFDFTMDDLDATAHVWGELGLNYGRVLLNTYDRHYLKAGVSLKLLVGGGVAQFSTQSLQGAYSSGSDQLSLGGSLDYLISYDDDRELGDYLNDAPLGFGGDIGIVYEYRSPRSRASVQSSNPRALNKYLFKIGLSVVDIGQIEYENQSLRTYTLDGALGADEFEEDVEEALENNFEFTEQVDNTAVQLPTSLNVNLDYRLMKSVYLNLNMNQTLVNEDERFNNERLNLISLIPRLETRKFGAYLPLTYSELGGTTTGLGLRYGSLFWGSSTLFSNLVGEGSERLNFYFALKFALRHK